MSWYEPSEAPPAPPAYHKQRRRRAWDEYGRCGSDNHAPAHAAQNNATSTGWSWSDAVEYIDCADDGQGPASAMAAWQGTDGANGGNSSEDPFGDDDLGRRIESLLASSGIVGGAGQMQNQHQQLQGQGQGQAGAAAYGENSYVNQQEQQQMMVESAFHASSGSSRWPHPSYQYREAVPTVDMLQGSDMSLNDGTAQQEDAMGVDAANYFFYPRRLQYDATIGSQDYASQRPFVPEFTQSQQSQHHGQVVPKVQSQDNAQVQEYGQGHQNSQMHSNSQMQYGCVQQQIQHDQVPGQIQSQQQQQQLLSYQSNTKASAYPSASGNESTSGGSNGPTNMYQGGASYYSMSYSAGGGTKDSYRQSTIGVNSSTGALSAVQEDSRGRFGGYGLMGASGATDGPNVDRSWAGVGGNVGVYHHTAEDDGGQQPQPPKPTKKKRKSKKDDGKKVKGKGKENNTGKEMDKIAKKKKEKKQKQQDMTSSLLGFAAGAGKETDKDNDETDIDDEEDSDDFKEPNKARAAPAKKSKAKTKKRQKAATLLDLADEGDVFDQPRFDGIEHCGLLNAGQSAEALSLFLQMVKSAPSSAVAWTMIFLDRTCSTPFVSMAKKYCTEKGPRCTHWNCTCDGQVRATMASAPVLGAMFVVKKSDNDDTDAGGGSQLPVATSQLTNPSQNMATTECFILPLGPAKDGESNPIAADPGYARMSDWPAIFDCETSIPDRWKALRTILLDKQLTCITYNAAVGLLPYHYHRENDGVVLGPEGQMVGGQTDLIFPRLWDLRLTSWIINPDRGDTDLEFATIYNGFSHFQNNRSATNRIPPNASDQLLGLLKAQDFLEFLLAVYPIIDRQLDQKGLRAAYEDIEAPTTSILSAMETNGIGFVTEPLIALQRKLEARIDELAGEAKNLARDNTFLLSSPQQVANLLYDVMHINPPQLQGVSKSKTKSRSTSEEALKMIQSEAKQRGQQPYRIIEIILEFRSLNKILTTYARPLPLFVRDVSALASGKKKRSKRSKKQSADLKQSIQRIHPNWMQTAVRTGRLSCRKPNIQQVPTEGAFGTNIRDSFRASSSDKCLFACDYSQNEIRILAHMSNDQALIGMFRSREEIDIYKQMSAAIRGIRIEDVTDEDRKISKQVTLAILYGMGVPQVATSLSVSHQMARQHLDAFYRRFSGVKRWMDATKEGARRNSYVTTITGRRR